MDWKGKLRSHNLPTRVGRKLQTLLLWLKLSLNDCHGFKNKVILFTKQINDVKLNLFSFFHFYSFLFHTTVNVALINDNDVDVSLEVTISSLVVNEYDVEDAIIVVIELKVLVSIV